MGSQTKLLIVEHNNLIRFLCIAWIINLEPLSCLNRFLCQSFLDQYLQVLMLKEKLQQLAVSRATAYGARNPRQVADLRGVRRDVMRFYGSPICSRTNAPVSIPRPYFSNVEAYA